MNKKEIKKAITPIKTSLVKALKKQKMMIYNGKDEKYAETLNDFMRLTIKYLNVLDALEGVPMVKLEIKF